MASDNISRSFMVEVDSEVRRLSGIMEVDFYQYLEPINSATAEKEEGSDENMLLSSADQSNGKLPLKRKSLKPEPSTSKKRTVEEHFENGKTVDEVIKILEDRVYRRAGGKTGKAKDFIKSLKKKVKNNPKIKNSPYLIISVKLPVRVDLEYVIQELTIIKLGAQQMRKAGKHEEEIRRKTKPRLIAVEQILEQLDEKEKLEVLAPKAARLEPYFVDNLKHSALYLKEKLNEEFPEQLTEGASTNRPTGDQGYWQNADSHKLAELGKELFGKKDNNVGFSQFPGLVEEVSAAGAGKIPESLKPFATKIQEACGGQIAEDAYLNILILMSAAAREMKNCEGVHQLTWDSYMKWGATYNMACRMGLNVQFFKDHLEKLLYPYFCFHFKGGLGLFP